MTITAFEATPEAFGETIAKLKDVIKNLNVAGENIRFLDSRLSNLEEMAKRLGNTEKAIEHIDSYLLRLEDDLGTAFSIIDDRFNDFNNYRFNGLEGVKDVTEEVVKTVAKRKSGLSFKKVVVATAIGYGAYRVVKASNERATRPSNSQKND